jgi:hypothetical protein
MERIKNYTIATLFAVIGVLLLLRQCGDGGTNGTIIQGTTVSDTLTVHDTIRAVDTIITTKWIKSPTVISETPFNSNGLENESICKMKRTYADSVVDKNQTIFFTAKVIGRLDSMKIDYKLKIPLVINNTTTITNTRVDTLIKTNSPKLQVFLNGQLGGNKESFNMYPGATAVYKKVELGYSYGLLDKTHNVRIGYRIFKSKK